MDSDRPSARRYEELAEKLARDHRTVGPGTMMGFACLRCDGRFFASLEPGTGRLIVKLPVSRVGALVEEGSGFPFAPNGGVFREWVALDDASDWSTLALEALEFAAAG